jgi:mannose-6-phosphate isomerase-like protein (cupin superfamily)
MATTVKRPASLENPVTGHQVIFLQTGAETNGQLLQIEYIVPSREEPLQYIPLHFHHVAEERFETLSGRLGVIVGDKNKQRILEAGESVVIPPGTVHAFWNAAGEELRFITDIRPAGQLQTYWQTAFRLAAKGQVDAKGAVKFWQVMALFPVMDTYVPGLPAGVQKTLFSPLVWLSGRLGYRATYPEISAATAV